MKKTAPIMCYLNIRLKGKSASHGVAHLQYKEFLLPLMYGHEKKVSLKYNFKII